jgi:hypothetical protein
MLRDQDGREARNVCLDWRLLQRALEDGLGSIASSISFRHSRSTGQNRAKLVMFGNE